MYFFCYKMNFFIKSNVINKMIIMVYKAFVRSNYSYFWQKYGDKRIHTQNKYLFQ